MRVVMQLIAEIKSKTLIVFSPVFVTDTKIIFGYNLRAPLR